MMTASKKVCHVVRFHILFHFLLLSLATGTGKGDTPKGILLREGNGPRAPLLIRGSKAGPSEGFNGRLRPLGLRAHYWSEGLFLVLKNMLLHSVRVYQYRCKSTVASPV